MLVNGRWTEDWRLPQTDPATGAFLRQASSFRDRVTPDGTSGGAATPAEAGRYHLCAALSCPWASRALVTRNLKGLQDVVSVTVMEPVLSDRGWRFSGATAEPFRGLTYLHEIYTRADPRYSGRATVPVLWDAKRETIVNNESADIVRIFNSDFGSLARSDLDLYPRDLQPEIDALNERIYAGLNNGVYRAGFATTQLAYEEAFRDVFCTLDELEERLSAGGPFLHGSRFTETDIRLFVTLVRFDAAYHGLFKCNLRRLVDYAALSAYLLRVLALPGVRETVDVDAIKRGYYAVAALNPSKITPLGPELPF